MSAPVKDPNQIVITGRLSYPSLFQARKFKPKDDEKEKAPSYGASILLDKVKDAEQIKTIEKLISRICSEQWKNKVVTVKGRPGALVGDPKSKMDKVVLAGIALRDGSEKADKDGYGDDIMFVSASRSTPPMVTKSENGAFVKVTAQDEKAPYAGCYVKCSVRFWPQDNADYGKRVNAELRIVGFYKHGEPFGAAAPDAESEFAGVNLDEEDESAPAAKATASNVDLDIDDMG